MVEPSLTFIGVTSQSFHHIIPHTQLGMHVFAYVLSLHLSNQEYVFGHHELYGTCCLRRSE